MIESLCDICLEDCKASKPISACRGYNNPARRQFDWRCRICNKRVPNFHKLCLEHNAWLGLLQKTFGLLGLMSKLRDILRRN